MNEYYRTVLAASGGVVVCFVLKHKSLVRDKPEHIFFRSDFLWTRFLFFDLRYLCTQLFDCFRTTAPVSFNQQFLDGSSQESNATAKAHVAKLQWRALNYNGLSSWVTVIVHFFENYAILDSNNTTGPRPQTRVIIRINHLIFLSSLN